MESFRFSPQMPSSLRAGHIRVAETLNQFPSMPRNDFSAIYAAEIVEVP